MSLLESRRRGLYCVAGDFYIDPREPVERAVITHAHGDHARRSCRRYLAAAPARNLTLMRLGRSAPVRFVPYGQVQVINGVKVTLFPAGHILGSAQVRIEHQGEVWCVSGDYKRNEDPTCDAFEPVRCHTFITECTFGHPTFRWPQPAGVVREIESWWRANQQAGRGSLLLCYAIGKSQRILAALDRTIGPIMTHASIQRGCEAYRADGVSLPLTRQITRAAKAVDARQALVIAPPGVQGTPWMRRLGPVSTAMASGWMQAGGLQRWPALDRGFVLSDHADWDGLLTTIRETGAEQVWATHGDAAVLVEHLRAQSLAASAWPDATNEARADTSG